MRSKTHVGSISAQGYIIREAQIFLDSPGSISDPDSAVEIKIVADLIWVNRSDEHWSCKNEVELQLDMDAEEFLMDKKAIEVINKKNMFDKIMRVLVESVKS